MSTRPAAVAGYFYDADADRLQQQLDDLINAAPPACAGLPKALIVPHAGYIYSGAVAASAYRCLSNDPHRFRRVLMLGPAHRVYVESMAIPSVAAFATPLGEVALDTQALQLLGRLPEVQISDAAHRDEHCLEVQLPFLQCLLGDFQLLPLLVGAAPADRVAEVIDRFAGDPQTLVVISSDLSHFLDYRQACRVDAETCELIGQKSIELDGKQACGARAINGLMASRQARALQVTLLDSCNSGDTAGKRERVVGYAAFCLR